jgi:antitoxin ParD1/3/4
MARVAMFCHTYYRGFRKPKAYRMQTMNISLPDQLKEFVDDQVSSGRYSSVSEYVRDLIRNDEKRKAQEKLEALLLEGLQSSQPTGMTRRDWEDIRREALKQFEARKSRKTA